MERKFLNRLLLLSGLILVAAASLFFYCYFNPQRKIPGCGTDEEPLPVCGNGPSSPEKLRGKEIFNTNCAACHKINAMTTPDFIKNVFEKIPNEQYFDLFITNEDSLLKAKHPRATKLQEEFPNGFRHNFKLSKEEIENLKLYIK
ncbi:c-type cytochrome [Flavobacterium amniphilum]|uniref:c-type cytochrome n=1 Tax=Flavobacterium amniphilum TaxID=1834035 RepID=UPI00202A9D17|nr:c-type cytochrome [Flavobacterium amniphilum]MCL9806554.1 c-type cytochrome [Flavobacterium amniphilum]